MKVIHGASDCAEQNLYISVFPSHNHMTWRLKLSADLQQYWQCTQCPYLISLEVQSGTLNQLEKWTI